MGSDRRIIDSDENEAKVDATLEALKVDVVTVETGILATIDGVLDAIQALLEGTQLSKIWDGTETLLIDANGKLGAVVAQATPANLKTAVYGLFGETQVQIAVDTSGKLSVTF